MKAKGLLFYFLFTPFVFGTRAATQAEILQAKAAEGRARKLPEETKQSTFRNMSVLRS